MRAADEGCRKSSSRRRPGTKDQPRPLKVVIPPKAGNHGRGCRHSLPVCRSQGSRGGPRAEQCNPFDSAVAGVSLTAKQRQNYHRPFLHSVPITPASRGVLFCSSAMVPGLRRDDDFQRDRLPYTDDSNKGGSPRTDNCQRTRPSPAPQIPTFSVTNTFRGGSTK